MQIDAAIFVEPQGNVTDGMKLVGAINLRFLPYSPDHLSFFVRAVFEPEECDQPWTVTVILRDPESRPVIVSGPVEVTLQREMYDAKGYVNRVLSLDGVSFSEKGVYTAELTIVSDGTVHSHVTSLPVLVSRP